MEEDKDIVPFDLAKKLKEKGFDCKTRYGYLPPMSSLLEAFCDTNWSAKNGYSAPTISQVLKWLRNEKKIFINVDVRTNLEWYYEVWNIKGKLSVLGNVPYNKNNSYEQAAIAGIEYVVENLI